jgi:uroporphyrinogen decarboxylase
MIMNGYERIMAALKRKEPDIVPVWELIVNAPVIKALYGDISYEDFVEKEGLDGITVFENQHITERLNDTQTKDEWGILWTMEPNGIAYPSGGPIKTETDLDRYIPPDPDADFRLDSLRQAIKRFKGEKAIIFLTHDAFEFSHYLRGMSNLLMDYLENPEFAKHLARMVIDYKKRVAERAIDEGADVILTGDDYAYRTAPIMSPSLFREFILPYLQEMVALAKSKGVPFIKHTDGNLWPIMDMIVDTEIDAIDPIEPIADMDIGKVKELYGDRIALIGNIDCTELLTHGTPDDVVEAVKETIAKAGVGGGYILASSNSIHPGVNPENYKAMVKATREYGRYPLDEQMIEKYKDKNYIKKYL